MIDSQYIFPATLSALTILATVLNFTAHFSNGEYLSWKAFNRISLATLLSMTVCIFAWMIHSRAGMLSMGHRTKRFFQWSGKMGERLWEPKGLGVVWKMGWIFRSGFFLYMGLHLLYVWGAFLRISGRLLYIGLADGAKTAWKGFVFGCVAVLWLGWWILLYDDVNGCVAVFLCIF